MDWGIPDFIVSGTKKAFDFMSDEGVMSAFAQGAAIGTAGYLSQKEQMKHEEDLYNRKLRDNDDRHKASTVSSDEYASHAKKLTGGLLTQGQLIK